MRMPEYIIYFDALHEARWFAGLDYRLSKAVQKPFDKKLPEMVAALLKYDRPDIILCDGKNPLMVVERSEEVPTGHNVGQRFGRLVAAAEAGIPCVYFFPFAAFKHGGITKGPRYVNLRLLQALDRLQQIHNSLQLAICWPVDSKFELVRTVRKDKQIGVFVKQFLDTYGEAGKLSSLSTLNKLLATVEALESISKEMERITTKNPEYKLPPESVRILSTAEITKTYSNLSSLLNSKFKETVLYRVGMTYVRSDPYTGTAMIYDHIYCRTETGDKLRNFVLHFDHLTSSKWNSVVGKNAKRKDVRLYLRVADAILFQDGTACSGGTR